MTLQEGMTRKERKMLKAARKRYRENKDLQTVANEMNLAYQTVKNYFSGDKMERFERYYSESDKQLLEAQLQQMVKDGTKTALEMHSDVKSDPDVKPRVKKDLMKEAQKIPERHINMLQEMGILPKPKQRKEVTEQSTNDDVMERMQEALKEKQEEDEDEKQTVEA